MAFSRYFGCILVGICLLCAVTAQAQTVSYVSGNGQLVKEFGQSGPMTVMVRDTSGNPLKGVGVTWSVVSGPGSPSTFTTYTDSKGNASYNFNGPYLNVGTSYGQSTVTATYGKSTVSFTATTIGIANDQSPYVSASVTSPALNQLPLSGAAGQQGSVPVKVLVSTVFGTPIGGVPNVGVTVTTDGSTPSSTVACSGGTILTDKNGNATCNLVYGGKVGQGSFTLNIGGGFNVHDYPFNVVVGSPAAFVILQGNNQTGKPGATLPIALGAQLTDTGGNPLSKVSVVFEPVVAGTVTLSNVSTATDSNGKAFATVKLVSGSGNVQVRVRTADSKVVALFNLTINIVVSALSKTSGDQQSTDTNTQFGDPLFVTVTDQNNQPVQGAPVTFAVTSGSATLATPNTSTNSAGQAATLVTAGATAGPITVTATTTAVSGPISQTFNLTSKLPGPDCTGTNAFVNGASFQPKLSPGAIATITCKGLAPGIQGSVVASSFGPLPLQMSNVTVDFDGHAAPIYSVSNINGVESANVQVPFEVTAGTAVPVTIAVNGVPTTVTTDILPAAPGLFETIMSDGQSRAVALRPDGSVVELENRAQPGEELRVYATGLIPDAGTIGTNMFAPLDSDVTITSPVIVGVNNAGIPQAPTVIYARGLIGVWEVRFVVPSKAPPNKNTPFVIAVPVNGKLVFAKGTTLPIQ